MKSLSGKFVLRVPVSLHRRLRRVATQNGSSLNQTCFELLSRALSEPGNALAEEILKLNKQMDIDPLALVLFGSTARGEDGPDSDTDVLIILPDTVPIKRELYRKWDTLYPANGKISPHFVRLPKTASEAGSIWFEAAMEGKFLWDPEGTGLRFFRELRNSVAEGKVRRRQKHGHPYWVREDVGEE